jgi:CrcB protein
MVFLGAAAGGVARYAVGLALLHRSSGRFPWGTVIVNVSGCFLIGLLMTLFTERWPAHANWRLLLITGGLGGYTTFSSFEWETYQAVGTGNPWAGLANVVLSVVAGYGALVLGALLARRY